MVDTIFEQINDFISKNPTWSFVDGRLEKTFVFKDFSRSLIFLNKIVNPIEEQQSYPLIKITYNRVFVSLFNHTRGTLTEQEIIIAQEMDRLA